MYLCVAPQVSPSIVIGQGGSELGLLSSGVFFLNTVAGAMLCREFENSFSHIFKISSSAKRENTVWKLQSDGGPESGGSKSAPILSW